jgi:steroid delta-isomerase-like uncharacterized protein
MEANKAIVRRMIEMVWNARDVRAIEHFFAPDFVNHSPVPGMPPDRAGLQQSARVLINGFPDIDVVIDDLIAEGDQVVARMTMTGTHRGNLAGIPPTGKSITMTAISILRIRRDQIVERWSMDNAASIFQELTAELPKSSVE